MEAISKWIEGDQDYNEGIALYEEYTDGSLMFLFKMSQTTFTETKLLEALSELVDGDHPDPQGEKPKIPENVVMVMRTRTRNHEALFHQSNDADRFELAKQIKEGTRELDAYFDNGVLPTSKDPMAIEIIVPDNAWQMLESYGNNKSYISKNQNRASKHTEVTIRTRQNEAIQERLKSMDYAD